MESSSDSTLQEVVWKFLHRALIHSEYAVRNQSVVSEQEPRWERGADLHFRPSTGQKVHFLPFAIPYQTTPGYDNVVECLNSDAVIGRHLNRLVGTEMSSTRLDADTLLRSLISAILENENTAKQRLRFDETWGTWMRLFNTQQISVKTVAPLPGLSVDAFPLRLNSDLVLDCLTEDEVNRCAQVGVLRPISPRFPLIDAKNAFGIRYERPLAKIVRTDSEQHPQRDTEEEGHFGRRSIYCSHLTIEDVLTTLRIFRQTTISAAGYASWTTEALVPSGTTYRELGQWPNFGSYHLSNDETSSFLALWRLMEEGAARFSFSIHRFNLAFDRRSSTDRIVDLMIAAEAMFLNDQDTQERGELRFRLALRAAKFIEHQKYSPREVFRILLRAYDARSSIVHGGTPRKTGLPDDKSAQLPALADVVEELMRLALRKALSMRQDGMRLKTSEYWEEQLFID